MMRLKYCPDLIKGVDAHRAIALAARFRRHRRCVNVLFLAAAVTTLFAPLLLNTDVDNASFIGLSDQKVEHLIADDTVSDIKRKTMVPVLVGYIGKTNSVMSSALTPSDVSYTGLWAWVDDGNGNYRIRFLTSGTLTLAKSITVDIWYLGGGAGGGNSNGGNNRAGGGGGGGRVGWWGATPLAAGTTYTITIGAGGPNHSAGGGTTFVGGGYNGGVLGGAAIVTHYLGTSGGSGGGSATGGNGGSNGSNGANGDLGSGGTGGGTSTYEFNDPSLTLYAGGGGAGGGPYPDTWHPGVGGWGGGANGGNGWSNLQNGNWAAANTGGGGGGAGVKSGQGATGGWGGSGILVIRNSRG